MLQPMPRVILISVSFPWVTSTEIKEYLTNIYVSPPQSLHKHLEVLHLIHLGDPRTVPTTHSGTPNMEEQDG